MKPDCARASTSKQVSGLQPDTPRPAGCEHQFADAVFGVPARKPSTQPLLAYAYSSDAVSWRPTQLGHPNRCLMFRRYLIDTTSPGQLRPRYETLGRAATPRAAGPAHPAPTRA